MTRSEQIPLERNVTDYRYPQCLKYSYDYNKLPTITVVIIFHNDALSMILRTVHSILMRTPDRLLSQVMTVVKAGSQEVVREDEPLKYCMRGS